eukprot:3556174-Rhodomonas_salina.2
MSGTEIAYAATRSPKDVLSEQFVVVSFLCSYAYLHTDDAVILRIRTDAWVQRYQDLDIFLIRYGLLPPKKNDGVSNPIVLAVLVSALSLPALRCVVLA